MPAALPAAAVAISAAGLGLQIFGASEAADAARDKAAAEGLIQQAQTAQIIAQQKGQATLAEVQKRMYEIQTAQSNLQSATQRQLFGLQTQGIDLSQQANQVQRGLNQVKAGANAQLKALNNQNAALNNQAFQIGQQNFDLQIDQLGIQQQQVGVQSKRVDVQARVARLANIQNQRNAIRKGLAEQAVGLQAAANQGALQSSRTSQVRGNAVNQAYQTIAASNQQNQAQQADFSLQQQNLGLQSQYYGVQQQIVGNQASIADLGNQSYNLGVQAQNIQYGVNQAQFAAADTLYGIQDQQYDLSKQGIGLQIQASTINEGFVNTARDLNVQLIESNLQTSREVAAAQAAAIAAGGQISDANYALAQAGSLSAVGAGVFSFGNLAASSNFQTGINNISGGISNLFSGDTSVGQPLNILPTAAVQSVAPPTYDPYHSTSAGFVY